MEVTIPDMIYKICDMVLCDMVLSDRQIKMRELVEAPGVAQGILFFDYARQVRRITVDT